MKYLILTILFAPQLQAGETIYLTPYKPPVQVDVPLFVAPEIPAEAQPTPHEQIRYALWGILKLTDKDSFVDFGCGTDARVAIAAGLGIKSKCIGIEIDPARARAAKERVELLGLTNVEIVEGDATKVDVSANVGFAYLPQDVLYELIPNVLKLDRFVSFKHKIPDLPMKQIGEFWYWDRSMLKIPETGIWEGVEYGNVVCNDRLGCPMCFGPNGIAIQIQQKRRHNAKIEELIRSIGGGSETKQELVYQPAQQTYTDETYKVECNRKFCTYQTWRTFADGSQVMLRQWRVDN